MPHLKFWFGFKHSLLLSSMNTFDFDKNGFLNTYFKLLRLLFCFFFLLLKLQKIVDIFLEDRILWEVLQSWETNYFRSFVFVEPLWDLDLALRVYFLEANRYFRFLKWRKRVSVKLKKRRQWLWKMVTWTIAILSSWRLKRNPKLPGWFENALQFWIAFWSKILFSH